MGLGFDAAWELLGQKYCIIFGKECASAAIWMFFSMVLRFALVLMYIERYVPCGLVFAFPYLIQMLAKYLPFIYETYPLLPTRLAESIIGRISPHCLTVVIPAHFLGCVFGTVLFRTIFPVAPISVFYPVQYQSSDIIYVFGVEATVVCMYISCVIAVPELLDVNRLSKYLLSVPVVPLMIIGVPDRGSTFNPAAQYALWYVYGHLTGSWVFQPEHMVAPLVGSIAAGILCMKLFPDDPTSWRKS